PAQTRLGEEDLEVRETIEDAGQDELRKAHRRGCAQERQRDPLDELARPDLLENVRRDAGVLEGGLRGAGPEAVEADVHRQRQLHLDGGGPEAIVFGRRVPLAAGKDAEADALEAEALAVLELGDGVVDVGPRNHAETDEPVARRRAVL